MESHPYQIGRSLTEAREAAGLKVVDVRYQARIPTAVIEALEAEDFSFFSSPTYAKSFLRQYSEFLNVDADEWLEALQPGSYVAGQVLGTLVEDEESLPKKKAPVAEPQMSGWSAVWLMALSGGLLYGGFKGYEILDRKLGGDETAVVEPEQPPAVEAEPAPVVERPADENGYVNNAAVADHPKEGVANEPVLIAPRAIIVRE